MDGPKVKIEMFAEREVPTSNPHQSKRVPTSRIEPGGTIFYTIKLVNEGDSTATNVVVDNPVPKGATYVAYSAIGKGSRPRISTDGGESYLDEKKAGEIVPESVTDVRWIVDDMPAGSRRTLEFQVCAITPEATALARFWTAIYLWLLSIVSK